VVHGVSSALTASFFAAAAVDVRPLAAGAARFFDPPLEELPGPFFGASFAALFAALLGAGFEADLAGLEVAFLLAVRGAAAFFADALPAAFAAGFVAVFFVVARAMARSPLKQKCVAPATRVR